MIFQIKQLFKNISKRCVVATLSIVGAFIFLGCCFMLKLPKCTGNDAHWVDFSQEKHIRPYKAPGFSFLPHFNIFGRKDHVYTESIYRYSKYVPMRDGVEIALDAFIPAEFVDSYLESPPIHTHTRLNGTHTHTHKKIPTMIQFTRYNREMTTLWPFTVLPMWMQPQGNTANTWSWQLLQALAPNGYAVVIVDARGTGASYGTRPIDFAAEETRDFKEIVEWVKAQEWSNGHVAAGGISYDGMSGMQAAAQGGVDAVVALFTPIDVVSDLIQPGGMVCSSFVDDYSLLTSAFEKEGNPGSYLRTLLAYPWHVILGFYSAFHTPTPVLYREADLQTAVQQHTHNWFMPDLVRKVRFKDDVVLLRDGRKVNVNSVGITEKVMEGLSEHNVPAYIVGGYCDSSSVRGSARLFSYLQTHSSASPDFKNSKLVLGPWTHSGRRNCSPHGGSYACFENDMYLDVLRFLDCQLEGRCWKGIEEELLQQNVHYWNVGEETWVSSDVFPPRDLEYETFHFTSQTVPDSELMHTQTRTHISQSPHDWKHGDVATYANEVSDAMTSFLYKAFSAPHTSGVDVASETQKNTESQYKLVQQHTHVETQAIEYNVDYTASSGFPSRWAIAEHPFRVNVDYSQRHAQHHKTLNFVAGVFEADVVMTGAPWVRFSLELDFVEASKNTCEDKKDAEVTLATNAQQQNYNNSSCPVKELTDVTVFAYLEDVDVHTGEVVYVTEGRILLSHRTHNRFHGQHEVRVGSSDVVYQPGTRDHFRHTAGGLETVSVTLEPISYTFKAGHALRLSLAGSDVHNFVWAHTAHKYDEAHEIRRPDQWNIHMGPDHPAWVKIPVRK